MPCLRKRKLPLFLSPRLRTFLREPFLAAPIIEAQKYGFLFWQAVHLWGQNLPDAACKDLALEPASQKK